MRALNGLSCAVAALLFLGEVARFWGDVRFFPMAFDEIGVAALLIWAATRTPDKAVPWHLAGWGACCGMVMVLLVETASHQIHGPQKAAGPVYLFALSTLLLTGLWALLRAFALMGGHVIR